MAEKSIESTGDCVDSDKIHTYFDEETSKKVRNELDAKYYGGTAEKKILKTILFLEEIFQHPCLTKHQIKKAKDQLWQMIGAYPDPWSHRILDIFEEFAHDLREEYLIRRPLSEITQFLESTKNACDEDDTEKLKELILRSRRSMSKIVEEVSPR